MSSTTDVSNPTATVSGTCVANDDEDGVSFDTTLVACETADLTVTASIGVSSLTTDSSGAEMLRAADMALYRAKREGRNRLCIAPAGSPAPA